MAATTIFFNGRLISVPGSYSEVDASGLETSGLSASGIVAVLGTSEGGIPWGQIDAGDVRGSLQTATRQTQANNYFRSGDLKEAAPLLFNPSNDPDIPGGAQEIFFLKVNPAAASSASFDNADGEALVLTSADYGYFTTQISVEIADGTVQGKLITLTFETTEEVFDDVGGDTVFELQYEASTPADGFTTITAAISSSALTCDFTRTQTGLVGEVTNPVVAGQAIELLSSDASDTAVIRLFGTDTGDAAQSVTVTLAGTAVQTTAVDWNEFHGAEVVSGTLAGTLTIRNESAGTTITTIAPAGTEAAIEFTVDHPIASSALTVVASGAAVVRISLFGLSNTGAFQHEVLTLNGTTPVAGTALWSRLDGVALGLLAGATTLTISGRSMNAVFTGLNTLQKLADKFNGTSGYTFTVAATNPSSYASTDLDQVTATDIKAAAKLTAYGNLAAIVAKLNNESSLVTAAKGSVATGAPSNTAAAVFLTGGHEGSAVAGSEGVPTATTSDWTGALNLLKKVRVNTVVPLTSDPAIHALVKAHCDYMAGVGRSERDCVLGIENTGRTDVPTKTEAKAQIVNLNSRHCRVVAQAIERYNTSGEQAEYDPPFAACIVAGLQAGSAVGVSLSHKYANILKIRQDSSWNPIDDAEELIQAGLLFFEVVDGIGRRVVRNVTTHLATSNLAYTDAAVNEAVNYSVYSYRTEMERFVGKQGFAGTVNAAKAGAINILGLLMGVSLVAYRSLDVSLILDVLETSVEMAPVLSVAFVKNTIHLVAVPQVAA